MEPPVERDRRGRSVEVHPSWHALLLAKLGHPRPSYVAIAAALNKVVGRPDAFSKSAVERFVSGREATDQMLEAFCKRYELPYPILAAASPEEVRWFHIGRTLAELDPERFLEELGHLGEIADMRRRERELERRRRG